MNDFNITPIFEIPHLSDDDLSNEILELEKFRTLLVHNEFNELSSKMNSNRIRQIEDQICYLVREADLRKLRKNRKKSVQTTEKSC